MARSLFSPEEERLVGELAHPNTTHHRRAAIGDHLDALEDPRAGVALGADGTPDITWCDIPGGSLIVDGRPCEVQPFRIAKHLVTYRQYKTFVDDPKGFRNRAIWADLVRATEPGAQYRRLGNHPAETMSWYDAAVFCRWLSERLGIAVRVPHEDEWQQAATGGDAGNAYPWGAEWNEGRANSVESHLGRTTAVGMYPLGASAHGVLDLAGTVWEWCSVGDRQQGGRRKRLKEPQVIRGGGWISASHLLRTSQRLDCHPDRRTYYSGVRVACDAAAR